MTTTPTETKSTPAILLLLLFFVLTYLVPLNNSGLWQPDETRYAEISREMVQSGDWVVPHLLGMRYFEKPIAGYWVNSVSQLVFGENNFAVRFGSALSTGLSAILVFSLAMLLWRERKTAFAASLIYLSMILVLCVGTYSTLDPMFTLWMSAACVCSWLTLRAGTRRGKAGAWALLGLACGMGFLTKGFIACAVPVVAVLPVFVREKRFGELLRYGPLAVIAAALISLPWSLLIAQREPDFWNYFFWVEHIQRFAGERAQHGEPFWFYLPLFLAGSVPWLGLLPGALRGGWKERPARPELFFLLSWAIMPLLFFSLAKGKLPTYILPCMAPLALLLTRYGQGRVLDGRLRALTCNAWINLGLGVVGTLALAVLVIAPAPIPVIFTSQERPKLLLGGAVLVLWCLIAGISLRRPAKFWQLAAICPLLVISVIGMVLPERVTNLKQPQAFIQKHMRELQGCRFILTNNVGLAASLAWELKRKDLLLVHDAGELTYGQRYPDSRDRLLSNDELAPWLQQAKRQGDAALLLRPSKAGELPSYVPVPDAESRIYRYVLLLYRQRTTP